MNGPDERTTGLRIHNPYSSIFCLAHLDNERPRDRLLLNSAQDKLFLFDGLFFQNSELTAITTGTLATHRAACLILSAL